MIEPLPIGPNEASRVEEKLDETIREVNRLTALLAHLTLPIRGEIGAEGAVRWAPGPHPMQGEVQVQAELYPVTNDLSRKRPPSSRDNL